MPNWVGTSATLAVGTTSATPTWPTGYTPTAGDLAVMVVTSGHPTPATVPNTPSGWTLLETRSGGGGTYGNGVGPRRATLFYKALVGGETLAAVTQTAGTGATIGVTITVFSKTGASWDVAATSGEDTTAGTGFSVTGAANPGFASGDAELTAIALRDDAPTVSAHAVTAAGATFAASVERRSAGTTQGNDHRHVVATSTVSSGTSTGAPTATATLSAAHTGVAAIMRIRETAASGDVTATPAVIATAAALPRPAANTAAAPATAGIVSALPQVTAGISATPAPAVVPAVAAVPRPAVNVAAGPVVLPALAALVRPGVNIQAGPLAVLTVALLPQATPVAAGGATVTPGAVAAAVALLRPGIDTAAGPALAAALVVFPAAGVSAAAGPAVIPVLVVIPLALAGGASTPGTMTVLAAVAPQPTMTITAPAQPSMHGRQTQTAGMTGSGD